MIVKKHWVIYLSNDTDKVIVEGLAYKKRFHVSFKGANLTEIISSINAVQNSLALAWQYGDEIASNILEDDFALGRADYHKQKFPIINMTDINLSGYYD